MSDVPSIDDTAFEELLNKQRELQVLMGHNLHSLTAEERAMFTRDMVLALTHEAHELLDTTPWKPWAAYREGTVADRIGYVSELADVFTFLLNLALAQNVSAQELLDAVRAKRVINEQRQLSQYDGHWKKVARGG